MFADHQTKHSAGHNKMDSQPGIFFIGLCGYVWVNIKLYHPCISVSGSLSDQTMKTDSLMAKSVPLDLAISHSHLS